MLFLLSKVEKWPNHGGEESSSIPKSQSSEINLEDWWWVWKWLENRKVSHAKIISLTQWLGKDIQFWLGHAVKRNSNILQTTNLKFNIPRKRFTSDLKLRFKNLMTYLNGKHLNIDENYGRF